MASTALGEELGPPCKHARGGPGGWVILDKPEFHLSRHVVVPELDLAILWADVQL